MPFLPLALAVAATNAPLPTDSAGRAAAPAPVSHEMCALPAGWSPPFTHVYHLRSGATVVFVGVDHTADMADATHRQIRSAVERFRPDVVLIEGTSSAKSAFAWYRKDIADLAAQRVAAASASENLYAAQLAAVAGATVFGWDFSPDQDYRVLVADGFALPDALGAHLLRSHVDPFDGAVGRDVERQLAYAAQVQPIAGFDYAGWYRAAYGERYDRTAGTPCGTGIASRVVSDLSYRRNLNMVGLIEERATPGRTVLVEAGANHWLAVRDWLASRSTDWN